MTQSEYDRVAGDLMALARDIETSKRPGYTVGSEDVLANFKNVAARAGISVEQAWAVYFLKHIDAMVSIMTRPDLPVSEAPPGRFADGINYIRLGYALLHERSGVATPTPRAGKNGAALSGDPMGVWVDEEAARTDVLRHRGLVADEMRQKAQAYFGNQRGAER